MAEAQPLTRAEKIVHAQLRAGVKAPIAPGMMSDRIHRLEARIDALDGGAAPAAGNGNSEDVQDQLNELLGLLSQIDERLAAVEAGSAPAEVPKPAPASGAKKKRGRPKKEAPEPSKAATEGSEKPEEAEAPEDGDAQEPETDSSEI